MSLKSNLSSKLAALKKLNTAVTPTAPKPAKPKTKKFEQKKSCGEVGFISSNPKELQEHARLLKNWDGVATKDLFPVRLNSSADIERLNRLSDGKENSPIIKNRMYHNCIDPVVLEEAAKIFPVGTNAWKHILSGARGNQFLRFAKTCKGDKNLAYTILRNPGVTEELVDDALSINYGGDDIAYSVLDAVCLNREWLYKASFFAEKEVMFHKDEYNLLPFAIMFARNGRTVYTSSYDFQYDDHACSFLLSVLTQQNSVEVFRDFAPKLKLNGIS